MEPKTILVVEDNHMNMKLVMTLLELGSYRVLSAENAETGIKIAKENQCDLILMDIQLPGMDGLMATRVIKADEALKGIPVVALTSHAMNGDEDMAYDAGCIGYITKPINTRSFLTTIEGFLN